MERSHEIEILDREELPDELLARVHRDLDRTHRVLGSARAIVRALRRDPQPVRRIMDIGCGHGGLLNEVRKHLGIEAIGVDLRPPKTAPVPFPIVRCNAIHDPLPEADAAISALVAHHLSADELIAMIRNVGRSCRRFVILDLVRSRIPLILFQTFLGPFVTSVNREDGCMSIRRSYRPDEFRAIVSDALIGTGATFHHSVAPFYTRQVIDISY